MDSILLMKILLYFPKENKTKNFSEHCIIAIYLLAHLLEVWLSRNWILKTASAFNILCDSICHVASGRLHSTLRD